VEAELLLYGIVQPSLGSTLRRGEDAEDGAGVAVEVGGLVAALLQAVAGAWSRSPPD